ncbi:MAG: DUF5916 domain-containing protein [Candidatus Eiseniibacteriota bacterium]
MRLAAVLLVAILPAAVSAQPADSLPSSPHADAPVIHAAPLLEAVRVDGILDEPAWAAAPPASGFIQNDPEQGQPASEPTEVRVLFDGHALYIGARMVDREPRLIRSALARRDEPLESDLLELFIDSFHDHLTAFNFRVTPAGAIRDGAIGADGRVDNSWDAVWEAGTRIDSLGWVAEIRIPLSQLRYNAGDEVTWGIQFARFVHRKAEVSVFSFTPKRDQQGVFRYGHLEGLGRLARQRGVELLPYATIRSEHLIVSPGSPFRDGSDRFGAAGLDLKYGLTSDVTLTATMNPDFGQVEVDPAVVNLTAFETFFEEKRPFFVEGAEVFRFGQTRSFNNVGLLRMFHSRRIGRAPQRRLFAPVYNHVETPPQSTILGAVKVGGKTRGGWSIAALDAATDRELADYVDAGSNPQLAAVEPRTNYFAGRARRSLGQGNTTLGGLLTRTDRDLVAPALSSLLRSRAMTGGMDFSHFWGNRRWEVDGFVAGSHVTGTPEAIAATQRSSARYYQRPDATSFTYDPSRTALAGYAADLSIVKTSGLHWVGSASYQSASPGFEVNDLGFQSQVDRRSLSTIAIYRENQPGRLFREYDVYGFTNHSWNFDGDATFAQFALAAEGVFQGYWGASARLELRPRTFDDRLTRGGPVARLRGGGTTNWSVSSDQRRRTTYGANGSVAWNGAGGWGVGYGLWVNARPATPLLVRFEPSLSRSHAKAQYVTTVTDPLATATYGSRHVFADFDQTQLVLATRVHWAFTPKLSLQLYLQPLLAAGDYAEFKEFLAPRTFDFGVYGRDLGTLTPDADGYVVDPDGAGPAAPFPIFEPDFNFRSLLGNAIVRWEYRPGSALFFVWQQRRSGLEPIGDFDLGRDTSALVDERPESVFAVKATWWIGE